MSRNNYDRDACQNYFQIYRDCKSAWVGLGCCPQTALTAERLPDKSAKGGPKGRATNDLK